MTTRKITLTLPGELVEAAEAAVASGRARSVSAYVAAAAGAGEARMTLAEVMDRWQSDAGPVDDERAGEAEQWASEFMARNDARAQQRADHAGGAAA
jgi:Arc/MetJ-type ribon-helix-helix transcriptional regulator